MIVLGLSGWLPLLAQQAAGTADKAVVPTLVKFSGQLKDGNGDPLTGRVAVTFALYGSEQGGAPLWLETQNVQPDQSGHYAVMLGSSSSAGLPAELFASGEARWVGVQVQGQAEQPRVMLLSVPYAMKAADAATIGGLPPSAFVLAAPSNGNPATASTGSQVASSTVPPTTSNVTTTGGTVNTLPLWTTAPATTLDVKGAGTIRGLFSLPAKGTATANAGFNSQPMDFVASVFNSSTHTAVAQTFQWQAEPVGNDTAMAKGSLNLLFAQGTGNPTETGLKIASNGQFTFAAGQRFPGTGTVTQVNSGAGLTGGPITGSGTLSLASKTCAGGNALTALPFTCSPFATLAANSFTGSQTVAGNLSASTEVAAGNVPTGNVTSGTVEVDAAALNNGSWFPALSFAGGGEVIASNRAGATNRYGLDFFTNYTPRLSITNAGHVGIGTQSPVWLLDVRSPVDSGGVGTSLVGADDMESRGGAGWGT